MKKTLFLIVAVTFLLGGCAPWIRTGGPFVASEENVSMELPDGWMRLNTKDYFLMTRDGVDLQYVLVEKIGVNEPLTHTKKRFRKGMLPLEAAEVIMDNIASGENKHSFEVRENKPAKIDGKPGFRAIFSYKTDDGLKMKGMAYGLMVGDSFYVFQYAAPQRHYYDRNIKTFEKVVSTIRLISS